MHCKRARLEIALWVGNDLDDASIGRLQRHLAICPVCREEWRRMESSLRTLHDSSDSLLGDPELRPARSVWPKVAARLASPEFQGPASRFNGWVPALAIASIFLAMVVIANTARVQPTYIAPHQIPVGEAQFVVDPGEWQPLDAAQSPLPGGTRGTAGYLPPLPRR